MKTNIKSVFTKSTSLMFLSTMFFQTQGMADSQINNCDLPFQRIVNPKTGKFFMPQDAMNTGLVYGWNKKTDSSLKNRYIVANLNTADEKGQCKGVQEVHPDLHDLKDFQHINHISKMRGITLWQLSQKSVEELKVLAVRSIGLDDAVLKQELEALKNYLSSVHRFKTPPIHKPAVHWYGGKAYCVGQTMSVCEINTKTGETKELAQFITASRQGWSIWDGYYAAVNSVRNRGWDERAYSPLDASRDKNITGGGNGAKGTYFQGRTLMPNFMFFLPDLGLTGQFGNGIHEKTNAVSTALEDMMGSPISLGCLRATDFGAKFIRWAIPVGAKVFIHFYKDRYLTAPPQSWQVNQILRNEQKRQDLNYLVRPFHQYE